jgi:hypothetical protein
VVVVVVVVVLVVVVVDPGPEPEPTPGVAGLDAPGGVVDVGAEAGVDVDVVVGVVVVVVVAGEPGGVVVGDGDNDVPPWSRLEPISAARGRPPTSSIPVTTPRPRTNTPTVLAPTTDQRIRRPGWVPPAWGAPVAALSGAPGAPGVLGVVGVVEGDRAGS